MLTFKTVKSKRELSFRWFMLTKTRIKISYKFKKTSILSSIRNRRSFCSEVYNTKFVRNLLSLTLSRFSLVKSLKQMRKNSIKTEKKWKKRICKRKNHFLNIFLFFSSTTHFFPFYTLELSKVLMKTSLDYLPLITS